MRLLRAIPRRRTNRHPFSEEPVLPPARYALRRAALEEGAWLHLVDEPDQRKELRRLAFTAHRAQMANPGVRAELERWTAVPSGRRDGIPAAAGGSLSEPPNRWVLRGFGDGSARAWLPGKDFENEPLLAVLSAHLNGPFGDVQAGLALGRILLTATADGLAASFLSHVVEVRQTREELRRLMSETRPPQAVLRIGRGYPVATTLRREVEDLLTSEPSRR
jgi:hypothetical protein